MVTDAFFKAVRANLADAMRVIGGSASDVEKAEARIEADVYEAIQQALSK
jgi:F-type H+-transporting ATPase subunit delta